MSRKRPNNWRECARCLMHFYDWRNSILMEACASVGISRNRSTEQVLNSYMAAYHRGGHQNRWTDGDE